MKKKLYFILMADVVNSRNMDQNQLMVDFKEIVNKINVMYKRKLKSPVTITLGDEFQSVVNNLSSALEIIVHFEELIIERELNFKLRYVLFEGEIETEINKEIAYEMLGSGLTDARLNLTKLKNAHERFHVEIKDGILGKAISNAFIALQGIVDDWKPNGDYAIISKFLELKDYKQVAVELNKGRSLMWKRERSIKMKEYLSLKNVINYLGGSRNA